jgi:hypothetical protein
MRMDESDEQPDYLAVYIECTHKSVKTQEKCKWYKDRATNAVCFLCAWGRITRVGE